MSGGAWPHSSQGVGPHDCRTGPSPAPYQSRSGCPGGILRRLCDVGRSHRSDPKVRIDGEIAIRESGAVALRFYSQPADRNHDEDCFRVWCDASKQKQDLDASLRQAMAFAARFRSATKARYACSLSSRSSIRSSAEGWMVT